MISNWIVFIMLAIRQFTWPYQNNFGQPTILPTLIYKCKWIYYIVDTISLPNSDEVGHIWLRLIPIPAGFLFTLVQCFPSPLKHVGLQINLQSCIKSVIGPDISNITILPNCYTRQKNCSWFWILPCLSFYLSHFLNIAQINMSTPLGSIPENWKAGPTCLL